MAASVVLIIYYCPFVLWAKPMHQIRMTAEMVAVRLCYAYDGTMAYVRSMLSQKPTHLRVLQLGYLTSFIA